MAENSVQNSIVWKIVHLFGIALAAIATEVFVVLSLAYFRESWGETLWLLAVIGGSILNLAVFAVDYVFYFLQKEVIYKFCITIYIVAVFLAGVFYIFLRTGFYDILHDEEALETFLKSGWWMYLVFVLLQFLQVVVLPIPSTITVVAGSVVFGPWQGSLLSLLGIVIGSVVAFFIGRYAGPRVVGWLVGKETLEKWLNKIKGKDKLLLTAMFLLPVFPDDVLCFVAGMSSMSFPYFITVILISRVLAIFTTSYSIELIPFNTWWGILIWVIIGILVIILFVLLYKKSDAILDWFARKFHKETRVEEKTEKGEFTMEVIDPDGSLVKKGVQKGDDPPDENKKE